MRTLAFVGFMLASTSVVWAQLTRDEAIGQIRGALELNQSYRSMTLLCDGTLRVDDTEDQFRIELYLDGTDKDHPRLGIREFVGNPLKVMARTWTNEDSIFAYSVASNTYSSTPFGITTRAKNQSALDSLLQKLTASTRNQLVHIVRFARDVAVRPARQWLPWMPSADYYPSQNVFGYDAGTKWERMGYEITDPDAMRAGDEWVSGLRYTKSEIALGKQRLLKWHLSVHPGYLPGDDQLFMFQMPASATLVQPGR